MIIPFGHDESQTRRFPVVSAIVIVVCMGAWIATLYELAGLSSLPPEHYREQAHAFWLEHAFLAPDGELAVYMLTQEEPGAFPKDSPTQADWELWLTNKRLASASERPKQSDQVVALQEELDRLTAFGFYLDAEDIPPEGDGPHRAWGLIPAEPSLKTFFSHMFMHGSWAHILGNLFLFFLVAPALEDRFGRPLFAAFYCGAGLFAGGFHMALSLGSPIPLVGASGAIAGVMGAFLVLFWKTRIKFLYFFLFIPPIWGTFHVGAWLALPLWFGNEMLSAWITQATGVSTGVAYWAHVGGFLFGSLFATTLKGFRLEERFLKGAIEDKVIRAQGKAVLEQARRALEEQVYEEAFLLLQQEVELRPNDPEVLLAYWEAAVAFYRPEDGAAPLGRWMCAQLTAANEAPVVDAWCRAVAISPKLGFDPNLLIPVAASLQSSGRAEEATATARYILSETHPALRAGTALRIRDLAKKLDPGIELKALERILAVADLPEPKRERVEADIASLRARGIEACEDPLADERTDRGIDSSGAVSIDIDDGGSRWQEPRQVVAAQAEANALAPPPQPLDAEARPEDGHDVGALPGPTDADLDHEIAIRSPDVDVVDALAIGPAASLPRFAGTKIIDVVPVEVTASHIAFQNRDGGRTRLGFDRVQAVSAAVITGLSPKPVLVIDMLLNWEVLEGGLLKGARMRSDRFDPRQLLADQSEGMQALRALLARIVRGSGGEALPSATACAGQPFSRFDSLAEYEREVLQVDA